MVKSSVFAIRKGQTTDDIFCTTKCGTVRTGCGMVLIVSDTGPRKRLKKKVSCEPTCAYKSGIKQNSNQSEAIVTNMRDDDRSVGRARVAKGKRKRKWRQGSHLNPHFAWMILAVEGFSPSHTKAKESAFFVFDLFSTRCRQGFSDCTRSPFRQFGHIHASPGSLSCSVCCFPPSRW